MIYNNFISDNCQSLISEKTSRYNEEGLEEAFFIVDTQEILHRHRLWRSHLPRIEPIYGIRCNEDPKILQLLSKFNIGFECTSKAEIKTVINAGIAAEKIIYNNPCKQTSHIKYACNNGVKILSFDSEFELDKIKNLYPDAKLFLCINVEDQSCKSLKFGCNLEDICQILEYALLLNLDVIGINLMLGTNKNPVAYTTAVEIAHRAFNIAGSIGYDFQYLHFSNGFDSNFGSLSEVSSAMDSLIDEYFPLCSNIKITADCSRWYVTSAYCLVANVIAKRKVEDAISAQSYMYYLNDGVYGSFSFLLYETNVQVTPYILKKSDSYMKFVSSLWGPTCDGLDCILKKIQLPELEVGDWVIFPNMGAYASSASSNFNGMPSPDVFYIHDDIQCSKICRKDLMSDTTKDSIHFAFSPSI